MKIQYIFILLILASCGTLRKASQNIDVQTENKTDSTAHTETTITEQVDTVVELPPDTTTFNLVEEDTTEQVIETPEVKITVGPNKNGKRKVTAIHKPKQIPMKFNRTTKIKVDARVIRKHKENVEIKIAEKERTSTPWWIWILIAVGIYAVLRIAWYYWGKYILP